jgi:NAD(P)-dependent dehydrogenase (short-subunit alcohol dehydrogenase family)
MSGRLRDKRCLIIGGSSGIGLASARRFLEESAAVFIAGLESAQGEHVVAELRPLGPVHWAACDATSPASVQRLFEQAVQGLGGIDVLFHVAGGSGRKLGDGPLHECTDDGWLSVLAANLTSTFLTNRAAVRHFLTEHRPGVILNTASVLALAPSPHHFDTCAYTAAKGAVIALSRQAAARYAADGIRVNVIAPGLIDTPMSQRALQDQAILQYLATKQPLAGGPGQPLDCAEAAVFLCSDAARLITGVVLPVDGGWCVSEGQLATADL